MSGESLAAGRVCTLVRSDWLVLRDSRSGLEYLRSQRELAEHGLQLTLHAYETRVYSEIRDVHDADGRYARLAAWLGGRGVPSIDDAMLELELQPLHVALRSGDEQAVLAEVAALLEVEPEEAPPAPGVERATERQMNGRSRARSRGWSLRTSPRCLVANGSTTGCSPESGPTRTLWRCGWTSSHGPGPAAATEARPAELLADDRFQRSIGVNDHDGTSYFNKERFSEAVKWLDLPAAAKLTAAAAKSGYRLDDLRKLLANPPKSPKSPTPVTKATSAKATPAKPASSKPAATRTTKK